MRKLTLIAATALAATALITTTAHAQDIQVSSLPGYELCGEVAVDGNQATGGCLVEASGTLNGVITYSGWSEWCTVDVDMRIGETGAIYAPDPQITGGGQCFLKMCEDETSGEVEMSTGELSGPASGPNYDIFAIDFGICVESPYGGTHYPIEMSGQFESGENRNETSITMDGSIASHSNWWADWTSDDMLSIVEL